MWFVFGSFPNSLCSRIQLFFNRPHYANWDLENMFHFVNRLDYATSGLICIACDRFTAHILGKTFTKRMVGKQYLALVWGHVDAKSVSRNPEVVCQVRPNVYLVQMALGAIDHLWPCGRMQKLVAPATDARSKRPPVWLFRECYGVC
ncbi:RNA pseudouridylate synthase domain-containing protein 1 [Fasciola hepatica]|uniref:RNA pseudouridylate synthase domain-containing protein 1 n=1 Tax=Fasciola hepatica TaxID=6192 RepID=A0A4E0R911_FASHE|nr:RNA pseudouridylate synthase domain-containing protein 1 [Fasciola hepatica]